MIPAYVSANNILIRKNPCSYLEAKISRNPDIISINIYPFAKWLEALNMVIIGKLVERYARRPVYNATILTLI